MHILNKRPAHKGCFLLMRSKAMKSRKNVHGQRTQVVSPNNGLRITALDSLVFLGPEEPAEPMQNDLLFSSDLAIYRSSIFGDTFVYS